MEDTMKVLKLLEELEDIVDEATGLPLSNKIMVDAEVIFQIVREIRLALPDDVQQAKWIRDERDRILEEAKSEYERIIREAKKQAEYNDRKAAVDAAFDHAYDLKEKFLMDYGSYIYSKTIRNSEDLLDAFGWLM